jgi:hypothetical protein
MSASATVVSVKLIADAQQHDEDHDRGDKRECDQRPADGVRRSRVGEEREGRAFVGPVGNAQDARDDGDGSAERTCMETQVLVPRSAMMTSAR